MQQLRRPLCAGTVVQAKQRCTDLRAQLDQVHSQIKALDAGQESGASPTEVRTIAEATFVQSGLKTLRAGAQQPHQQGEGLMQVVAGLCVPPK